MPQRTPTPFAVACALIAALAALIENPAAAVGINAEAMALTPAPEGADESPDIRHWRNRARDSAATSKDFERLAWAHIGQARRTLDDGDYSRALAAATVAETRFGATPDTLLLRGHALHNLHRFAEAGIVARELVESRGSARDHALLGDVLMERGDLAGAVEATQKFVDVQPGLESYARVAHLRWLHGDAHGAVDAMEQAVRAGDPRAPEPLAWVLTRLAHLRLAIGEPESALAATVSALQHMKDYPPALFESGRALLALDRTEAALEPLRAAVSRHPFPEYQWWLADTLALADRDEEARAVVHTIHKRGSRVDPRTTALFLATKDVSVDKAAQLAADELQNRGDTLTHDAAAWTQFKTGNLERAVEHANASLASGIREARVLLHAAIIFSAAGESDRAAGLFEDAQPFESSLTPTERQLMRDHFAGSSAVVAISQRNLNHTKE